ncbi:hypothetical protein JXB37_05205, partial [candidate division WOR-3 bacterium]|nr:hypothetical protein [candidate division WOR-3 bacterium]
MRLAALALLALCSAGMAGPEFVTVSGAGDTARLHCLGIDFVSESPRLPADAFVTPDQRAAIRQLGFTVEPLHCPPCLDIPDEYHTYQQTFRVFDSLRTRHPDIVALRSIGTTQWRNVPIYAVKISDNVALEEDEPAVLYTGAMHAREPLGTEIIIHLAKYLCAGYAASPDVRRWVDSTEIWLVPVVNPDGFMYMFESARSNPWWRKNQRDNNENGRFDYSYDGVDLNRNFDWRWTVGGDTTPGSWVYRGPAPGSEAETQAWCDLAREQQPVLGISYHSYGEVVIYPWSFQGQTTPDNDVYTATAARLAQVTGYSYRHSHGTNMSTDWLYARVGQLDFVIETGTQFIEPGHRILGICHQNFHGDTFLFNRLFYSIVRGHVTDSVTGEPLVAEVQVLGRVDSTLDPRLSDSLFGSFYRVLRPYTYTFRFNCTGYDTLTVTGVRVTADEPTRLEARLKRSSGIGARPGTGRPSISARPNPFTAATTVSLGREAGTVRVLDAAGRLVCTLDCRPSAVWQGDDETGRPRPSGVYFLAAPGIGQPLRVLLLR